MCVCVAFNGGGVWGAAAGAVAVCVRSRQYAPYSAYNDRSGLPRTRVHRPQYGGGFVHPRTYGPGGCWLRAWRVMLAHHGNTVRRLAAPHGC